MLTANNNPPIGWSALHAAVASGDSGRVQHQIDETPELLNASNVDGWTPLHVAVGLIGTPIDGSGDDGRLDILRVLILNRATGYARNKDGWTPLHVAVALNHHRTVQVVESLTEGLSSAPVTAPAARDSKGRTPLHLAAAKNINPEVVSILLGHGGDPNALDNRGRTPLHMAAEKTKNPEIVRRLLAQNNANGRLRNGKGQTPFDLAGSNKRLKGTAVYWMLHAATQSQ